MANPNNFVLDSDYPMDKITYFHEAEYNYLPTIVDFITVQHNLGYAPLVWAIVSEDNWESTISTPSSNPIINVTSNSDSIRIYAAKSGASSPFKIRIFGLAPYGSAPSRDETAMNASKFMVDSDYGYAKLAVSGSNTTDSAGKLTVSHSLGHAAVVMGWENDAGIGWNRIDSGVALTGSKPSSVTKRGMLSLVDRVEFYASPNTPIQYRIYADEL